jgi:hypothetical protein
VFKDWQQLYETSIHSLQSDEDDQQSITPKPSYLEPQTTIEQSPSKITLNFY